MTYRSPPAATSAASGSLTSGPSSTGGVPVKREVGDMFEVPADILQRATAAWPPSSATGP